jgi:hypothetical protein
MRIITRSAIALLSLGSFAIGVIELNPRIFAWKQTASHAVIAQQRAQSCFVTSLDIVPGALMYRPNAAGEAVLLNAGEIVCNPTTGATAEVSSLGIAQHIRSTTPELLKKAVDERVVQK